MINSKLDFSRAFADLLNGILKYPIWTQLAWLDVRQRYSRSIMGPLWITISTGILMGAMGPLYSQLFSQELTSYFQYLSVGFIYWGFISITINDASNCFIGSEGYIKQTAMPFSIYILRSLAKNLILFVHNFIIIVIVLILLPPQNLKYLWYLPIGIALVLGNLFWISLLLAMLGARFRDIAQMVANIIQVLFFVTPVMWKVEMLPTSEGSLVHFNPFYHLLEVFRAPLLGKAVAMNTWLVLSVMMIVGSSIAFISFTRFRSRIAYWI
jgi:ABC-type polysaccharide/polyol phosphate export permease